MKEKNPTTATTSAKSKEKEAHGPAVDMLGSQPSESAEPAHVQNPCVPLTDGFEGHWILGQTQ